MQGASSQRRQAGRRPALSAAALDPCFEPLMGVVRGRALESIHRGAIAVVDVRGALLGGMGDPFAEVLLRSAAKPFQAAAVVASGAAEAFSLTDREVAIMAASHAGAAEHVAVVEGLLERAELSSAALVCGSVEHMCSGKHAGMLLLARHLGVAPEGYQREEHPVQREIAGYIASLLEAGTRLPRYRVSASVSEVSPGGASPSAGWKRSGEASRGLFVGTDGCGVPVVSTTLYEAAWLYAALAAGVTPALARVRDAMIANPVMVAGEERLDTRLLRAGAGRVVNKGGAEGVQAVGLPAGAPLQAPGPTGWPEAAAASGASPGLGCVIKVEDGSSRPIPLVVALFLRAWGLDEVAATIEAEYSPLVRDGSGAEVGSLEVLVESVDLGRRGPRPRARGQAGAAGGPAAERDIYAQGPDSASRSSGLRLFGGKDGRVTVCRGDEKDVLRFLRDEWPSVDEETFGRPVEWSAEPYALVFRREKKLIAVLKGHFIGGIASVDELMVGEGSRGFGLGSLLLGRFEDEARRRRCSRITLRAVKDSPAEDFYRGRGYYRECVQYGYEFGYDYVRLICDVERALGEAGSLEQEEERGR